MQDPHTGAKTKMPRCCVLLMWPVSRGLHKVSSPQALLNTDANSAMLNWVLSVQKIEEKSKCEKENSPRNSK